MGSKLTELFLKAIRRIIILILHKMGVKKRVDILFEAINLYSTEIFTYETHAHSVTIYPFFNHLEEDRESSIIRVPKTTIVMQGPIDLKSDFTLKTVLHYLNSFPSTKIILSTWESEDLTDFRRVMADPLFNTRFEIVQSRRPSYAGISNINLQIVSTQAGITLARKEPTKYLLKTRTDQCLFSKLSLHYMESLLEMYPRHDGSSRILSSSQSTFLLRPYGLSDMITFGEFENVSEYWNVELDSRLFSDLPFTDAKTLRNESINGLSEIYLAKRYLKLKGVRIDDTLRQSLEAYRDHFLIADYQILDQVWNKYTYRRNKYSRLNFPIRHQELSHFIWRDLQYNLDSYLALESVMDKEGNF